MAECGICLDVLHSPVSIPCGHVHCERCLRGHISSGADALKSTCPTCRKPFHIATPDFTFVPQKYHDFILPCVRKVYMDIPSVAALTGEITSLTQRLESFTKENELLRQRYVDYRHRLEDMKSEKQTIIEREEEARREADDLRKKYESLRKYWAAHSRDDACSTMIPSRRSSQNFDTSREIFPKVEEHPVSLQDVNPNQSRPKRALPKCRFVKRQRTQRYSDVGSSSQLLDMILKNEDEEDE